MENEIIEITNKGYELLLQKAEEKIAKLESDLAFAQSMAETWKNNAKSWELLYEVAKMELKLKDQ